MHTKLASDATTYHNTEIYSHQNDCTKMTSITNAEMDMGWVHPWVGLGWNFGKYFGLGWVEQAQPRKFL